MTLQRATLFSLLFLALGCGTPQDDSLDGIKEGPVGHLAAKLCTDRVADAVVPYQAGRAVGASSSATSDQYDRPDCADHFTVEITGTLNASFNIYGRWADALPTTPAACNVSFADVKAYGYSEGPPTCWGGTCFPGLLGYWTLIGHNQLRAYWSTYSRRCELQYPNLNIQRSPYGKVRIAVDAYAFPYLFPVFKRAYAGVDIYDPPLG